MKTHLGMLFTVATICNTAISAGATAIVAVQEPGEWRAIAVGQLVDSPNTGTGPSDYWSELPQNVSGMEYFFIVPDPAKLNAEHYGKVDFKAESDGAVWIIAPVARPDIEASLKSRGWSVLARDVRIEVGYEPFGKNKIFQTWFLLERQSKAGDVFSLRTDTYQPPVVLRSAPSPALTPGNDFRVSATILNGRLRIRAMNAKPGYFVFHTSRDLVNWSSPISGKLDGTDGEHIVDYNWPARGINFGPQEFFRVQAFGPPIKILSSPADQTVKSGSRITLEVSAEGPPGLEFKWWKDGKPIEGATARTLTIPSTSASDAGAYLVVVQVPEARASEVSQPAEVNVTP